VKDPEPSLKRLAASGDRAAVDRLFRELYPAVYGFCFSMTRSQADAEDLAQQTFLQAFGSLRRFRPERPVGPWILRIAHNAFISQLRTRRAHVELDDPDVEPLRSRDPLPETTALTNESRAEVRRAVRSLSPAAQVLLILRYQQELTYEEIAAVIGKPVSTVTNRLFDARRQLARAMHQSGEGGSDALQLVGL
jgi:RNA polymerase sigma-70 factor, ECF subfamily